jgi:hypothetical protein
VCRPNGNGTYQISLHGEAVCTGHPVLERCPLCTLARTPDGTGWTRYDGTRNRCPTCAADAVETQDDIRRVLPSIRADMARLGVRLGSRVRVVVVDADVVRRSRHQPPDSIVGGVTDRVRWPDGTVSATGITVPRGLTETHFGAAVAHEIGHCWLIEQRVLELPGPIEEGLCQVFAAAWLKRRSTRFAAALRDSIAISPDPVYGEGYRRVHAEVVTRGITSVLAGLRDQQGVS